MSWNYRIVRKTKRVRLNKKQTRLVRTYDIHEVYYTGKKMSWTIESVSANGAESIKDLKLSLAMMLADAIKHPVMEIVRGKLVERNIKE